MDRIGVGDFGGGNNCRNIEIAIARGGRADANGLVGEPDVHRICIGGGMDRNRLNAHFMRSAVDTQRDFAPVGDQQFLYGHALPGLLRTTTSG